MTDGPTSDALPGDGATPHRRRPRYAGKNPRRFAEKYKEHDPAHHAATVAKVLASGETVAGMHRPILVAEILTALAPTPGVVAGRYEGDALSLRMGCADALVPGRNVPLTYAAV